MGVSQNNGTPKSSICLIGFGTIIFTIHFGGKIPLFLEPPQKIWVTNPSLPTNTDASQPGALICSEVLGRKDRRETRRRCGFLPTFTLPETNMTSPLKMDGWNTSFLLGRPIFRCCVSFRECTLPKFTGSHSP